jgi:hypothetical protein
MAIWDGEDDLEIPDFLFRRAKSAAAQRGIPLRQLVTEALQEKLKNYLSGKAMDETSRKTQTPAYGAKANRKVGGRSVRADRSGSLAVIWQ